MSICPLCSASKPGAASTRKVISHKEVPVMDKAIDIILDILERNLVTVRETHKRLETLEKRLSEMEKSIISKWEEYEKRND
jgi:hypothetical protein